MLLKTFSYIVPLDGDRCGYKKCLKRREELLSSCASISNPQTNTLGIVIQRRRMALEKPTAFSDLKKYLLLT